MRKKMWSCIALVLTLLGVSAAITTLIGGRPAIITRKALSPFTRFFSPGWGSCCCCGMPWNVVRGHDTHYGEAVQLPMQGGTVKANGTTVTVSAPKGDDDPLILAASMSSACFPLCENCWASLTPQQRLPYYRKMWNDWKQDAIAAKYEPRDEDVWKSIEKSVLAGN